ncbi:MAG: PadR family transcriptional regulator [Ilumatobacter sp.]|nr:PadR family transcriptional regulator [Ilumatobacter sp.]
MSALSGTGYAVIGLLSVRSWSTYELAQQVQRSLGWFWPRTERKIYDEARRLVERGYASSANEMVGRRRRTMYSITPAGRTALAEWLGADSAPMKLESEALVRVFFADGGSLDDLLATLEGMRAEAEEKLTVLWGMAEALDEPAYEFSRRLQINALGLRFQLDHHRMVAEWATWAYEQAAGWNSTIDLGGWDWRNALRS